MSMATVYEAPAIPPPLPQPADGATLISCGPSCGNGVVRWGGQSYDQGRIGRDISNSNAAWLYNGTAWQDVTYSSPPNDVPEPRNRQCTAAFRDSLVVLFGRHTETNQNYWRDMPLQPYMYNFTSGSWRKLSSNTTMHSPPLRSGSACALRGDTLIFSGGLTISNDLVGDLGAYHIPTGTWSTVNVTGAPPPPSYGTASSYDPSSDVMLLHGGRTSGVSSMTANANVIASFTALVFDGSPDTRPEDGSFAGIRAAWARPDIRGYSPPRAFHAAAWLPASRRFCAFGGIQVVSFGDSVLRDMLCVEGLGAWLDVTAPSSRIAQSIRSGDSAGGFMRRLQSSANSSSTASPSPIRPPVYWRQLVVPGDQAAPMPRAFHAMALAPLTASGSFASATFRTDPPLVITAGRDFDQAFSDLWLASLPAANASSYWTDPSPPSSPSDVFFVSYLAYGVVLFLLTSLCMLLLLRQARTVALREHRRGTAASAAALEAALTAMVRQEQEPAQRGVDPVIVDSLPMMTFKARVRPPAGESAVIPAGSTVAVRSASSSQQDRPYSPTGTAHASTAANGPARLEESSPATPQNAPASTPLTAARLASVGRGGPGGTLAKARTVTGGTTSYDPEQQEDCAICLNDFRDGETLRLLPCMHSFHDGCIRPWLLQSSSLCPLCKQSVMDGVV